MLGVIGEYENLRNVYSDALNSLISSAKYDPYLEKLKPSTYSHDDGWGRVLFQINENKPSLIRYRSLVPIFNDIRENVIPQNVNGFMIDIIHARKKSKGMEKNLASTQPIGFLSSAGSEIFIAHNGTLDKHALIDMLPFRPSENMIKECSDTCFLSFYLSDKISKMPITSIIEKLKDITISALNLMILYLFDTEAKIIFGSYYKRAHDYYKVYLGSFKNAYLIASSTLVNFYNFNKKIKWRMLENGEYNIMLVNLKSHKIKIREL